MTAQRKPKGEPVTYTFPEVREAFKRGFIAGFERAKEYPATTAEAAFEDDFLDRMARMLSEADDAEIDH